MYLVVGLGNPGTAYARNRHNIGYMAADAIVRLHGFGAFRAKFAGKAAEGEIAGGRVLVLKPTTFMNESGRAVAAAQRFYKIPIERIIVLHDEIDLPAGKLRVKQGGGHSGHNGLRSLHEHIGAEFRRLRFGVGHPGEKERVVGHVLADFARADEAWLRPLLDAVADNFALVIEGRDGEFMNRVTLAVNPPPPRPKRDAEEETPKGRAAARRPKAPGHGADDDDGL